MRLWGSQYISANLLTLCSLQTNKT
uniref:Uncharacterized protein n=1 Tax=Anguilla anguilla TaxID=7936 RepID=A0A0E9TNW0_ANGAN